MIVMDFAKGYYDIYIGYIYLKTACRNAQDGCVAIRAGGHYPLLDEPPYKTKRQAGPFFLKLIQEL